MMENWSKLSAGLAGLNIGGSAANIGKTLTSSYQAARERLGQIPAEDITELPQGLHVSNELIYLYKLTEL
ncbi:hypothetical protein FRC18_006187 [Serendipita sp. 400]|nr:hypothetical protein FRC18_006187 [Serendipita sp. 400]